MRVSINLKNNQFILKNGSHDITGKQEKEEWFATKILHEKITIYLKKVHSILISLPFFFSGSSIFLSSD